LCAWTSSIVHAEFRPFLLLKNYQPDYQPDYQLRADNGVQYQPDYQLNYQPDYKYQPDSSEVSA